MAKSKIEWCTRSDWNCIRGCSRVSPGCGGPGPHGGCYAEAIAARFSKPDQPFHGFAERTTNGPHWTGRVELIEDRLTLPLKWRKPARIFVSSTSDPFHEKLPDEAIDRVFAVMALAPQHTFMILTKRSARMRRYLTSRNGMGNSAICRAINEIPSRMGNRHGALEMPLPNVWLGVSIEDQTRADERREDLAAIAAQGWTTFVSYEPALGPVDWAGWEFTRQIISGGESGPRARPSHPDWHRATRDWCAANDVSYFFKQHGEWGHYSQIGFSGWERTRASGEAIYGRLVRQDRVVADGPEYETRYPWPEASNSGPCMVRVGKKRAGRLLDGREHNAFPATRIPT